MYELLITEFADQDLDGIVEYIAVKLASPPAAGAFLDSVDACYKSLRRTPRMFSECEDKYIKRKGYRKALINNYLLIYRIDGKARRVYVLRVFYAGQDYVKHL